MLLGVMLQDVGVVREHLVRRVVVDLARLARLLLCAEVPLHPRQGQALGK